jgi:glycolate oxidase
MYPPTDKNSLLAAARSLTKILGGHKVITDLDILETYAVDETSDLRSMPDILVRAESVQDVSTVLRVCSETGVPAVPRGAGSGVTGGAIAVQGGVVLSLERMNRILEIDRENMVAVVEPGAITGDIQKAARDQGLMYPPDPASLDICSIGGNVAENAGGPRAVKYGITKDYILGLECVLPGGGIIHTGGKTVKNVTGYNLTGIIIGSEGTLAVITKIYLRLIPAPPVSRDLLIPFDSLDDAIDAVFSILTSRVVPAAIEFMEEDALKLVSKFLGSEMPFPEARAHLLIQVDGSTEDAVYADLEKIGRAVSVPQERIIAAESNEQRERLWKARRSIREAIHSESPVFLAEDCSVPRSKIPAFLKELKSFLLSRNLKSVMFGHAGDGNVHIDVLKGDMSREDWTAMVPGLKKEIYERAIALGGTISGEHGIGFTRKEYIPMALNPAEIDLHRRIKAAFDPRGILNPGKVIPDA